MSGALNIMWTAEAWGDYVYWPGQDKKTFRRINQLIEDVQRSPFEGIGKPEPLKENHCSNDRSSPPPCDR